MIGQSAPEASLFLSDTKDHRPFPGQAPVDAGWFCHVILFTSFPRWSSGEGFSHVASSGLPISRLTVGNASLEASSSYEAEMPDLGPFQAPAETIEIDPSAKRGIAGTPSLDPSYPCTETLPIFYFKGKKNQVFVIFGLQLLRE